MKRLTLALVAVLALVAAVSIAARGQNAVPQPTVKQFDYLRVAPYVAGTGGRYWGGYRACAAGSAEWACREFPFPDGTPLGGWNTSAPNEPLRNALATLGNEGWELVSAAETNVTGPGSATSAEVVYLFKRQR